MDKLPAKVKDISKKVEKLIFLQGQLTKENVQLKKSNKDLLEELSHYKDKLKELEEKNKIVKLAKSLNEVTEGKKDLKLKVNELIREVDKCMALLNR